MIPSWLTELKRKLFERKEDRDLLEGLDIRACTSYTATSKVPVSWSQITETSSWYDPHESQKNASLALDELEEMVKMRREHDGLSHH